MTAESSSENSLSSSDPPAADKVAAENSAPSSTQTAPGAAAVPPVSAGPSGEAPAPIEVVQTADYYILVRGEHSLWWRRSDGSVSARSAWDLATAAGIAG